MLNRALLILSIVCGMFFISVEAKVLETAEKDSLTEIIKELPPVVNAKENQIVTAFDQGRGHLHRRKKILKHIYPILMAVLFAKLVVVPLILKLLIAATSSSFVMSKIALVTSVLVALSWLLGATRDKAKLQIVQYPASGSQANYGGWNVKERHTAPQYASSYSDWTYDNYGGKSSEKNFFL